MLFLMLSILAIGALVVYWRRHHFAKSLVTLGLPSDRFKNSQRPGTSENPASSVGVNPALNRPPNQTQSADVQRTLQTIQEINRINKLNADQQQKSHTK
jgi:hypothetical protein